MSGESSAGLAPTDSRYQVLLDASTATVEQPTVQAVLHSLRELLSSSVRLQGAPLHLLNSRGETLHPLEFDEQRTLPPSELVPRAKRIGIVSALLTTRSAE
jgi:hypothetical protein